MSNFKCLSHGGPGSGRYPKGSGKKRYAFNRGIVDTSVKIGTKTASTIGKTKIYQKGLIPAANTVADSKPIDSAIKFVDKVGNKPIKHLRKHKGFNYLYNSYFGGVKYISMKTGMSENAVRIALM